MRGLTLAEAVALVEATALRHVVALFISAVEEGRGIEVRKRGAVLAQPSRAPPGVE